MKSKKHAADEALQRLVDGNRRFTSGLRSVESIATLERARELAETGQNPFAIILTCSDSRVPTEMVFDCGLGDIFVIRVAGNITAPSLIATIEFAAVKFKTPLCVVMGHTSCGAISAAIEYELRGNFDRISPNLQKLVSKIKPSVRKAMETLGRESTPELAYHAGIENVHRSVEQIQEKSQTIRNLVGANQFKIVGACYDLHTGRVNFDLQNHADVEEESSVDEEDEKKLRLQVG